jgi:hypothetical protein
MSSKSKTKPKVVPSSLAPDLPDIATAQTEFMRREVRLWIALLLRVVGLGILTARLTTQVPFFTQNRPVLDALSGILALFPFITGWGKLHSWRIALGKRYVEAKRWTEAVTVLSPLQGVQGRFFDAVGEGRALWEVANKELANESIKQV